MMKFETVHVYMCANVSPMQKHTYGCHYTLVTNLGGLG